MTEQSLKTLKNKCKSTKFRTKFGKLLALRTLLQVCIFPCDYKPPDKLSDLISLTSAGAEWVPGIKANIKDISLSEINLALYIVLFRKDVLIDVFNVNYERIQEIFSQEITEGKIKFPWVYGRLLYDRFYDMFPRVNELKYEDTLKLLENTPQGVFQIGNVVVGPFGLLHSSTHRYIPAPSTVPLWHCPDPSCDAKHPVKLSRGSCAVIEAANLILLEHEKEFDIFRTWSDFYRKLFERPDHYDDMHPAAFPWLLANAFSHKELQSILARLIDQYSKELREMFPATKQFQNVLSGSAEKITTNLEKAQCFHLLLLMSDQAIINCIESLIDEKLIYLPPTETRDVRLAHLVGSWFDVRWECSQFGIRAISKKENISTTRLKLLLEELYKDNGFTELQWKLRRIGGDNVYQKIDNYVEAENPRSIIKDLIFNSKENLQKTFNYLKYGHFIIPPSFKEEERLVDKILWKLGFDIRLYPPYQELFYERLNKFLEIVKSSTTYDEHLMESIRSAGVNFFVSLEEILDYSLSFTAWALLSDHYSVTHFKFDLNEARRFMVANLNGKKLGSNEPLLLDENGHNTLYPLIQGFAVLAELCSELFETENSALLRQENELPGFHRRTKISLFPFLHKVLILDVSSKDYERVVTLLGNITSTLDKAQICNIRNRIEHKRKDFPSQEEILDACSAVSSIVNQMEDSGVLPLVYHYSGTVIDQYDRSLIKLRNCRGKEISVNSHSQFDPCRLPPLELPIILFPWIHIGDTTELLRFQFEEVTDYVKMWRDYPKR